MSLESPIHALASANESDNGEKFQSAVEEQTMSEFTSLFEAGPDLSIEESELMLLESSNNHFSVGSDTSDSVSSLVHTHDLSSPSDTYDLDTYFSPITPAVTPADPSCTSWHPNIDFDIIPIAEKSLLVHNQMDNMLTPRCHCIKTAISALEDTPALADIIAPSVVESTLEAYKRTLATYEAVLRCKRCSTSTSATVTALVVGDELVTALSRLRLTVGSWLDDAAHSQSRSQPSPISSEDIPLLLVGEDLSTRRITVGAYSVDSHKEWASIISALIEMLLARLERVLMLVRARIREGEGEGEFRIMVVRKLQERVRNVMGRSEMQKPCGGNAVFLDGLADCI
ncbi:hypothetical protein SLS60_006109 [Paraconiothyrium brasiliense]|uniref:Uncharacterized protein n=1 Tax=Paraconiothyrium brasiliense TaxID=300254 RepID=A0ABR3RE30_9PLEO